MKAKDRRKEIVALLMSSKEPIAGGKLAEHFSVSRQIIVQDIGMLKAAGYEILSTHYGYVLQKTLLVERVFKVAHSSDCTEDELSVIVANGGIVVDVFVWHRVYGKISAPLNIFSMVQVQQFMEGVRQVKSTELMHITGGEHYHTVRADNEEILANVENALKAKGYLVPEP
jgi:transcriptional regulator of NAD metabolism